MTLYVYWRHGVLLRHPRGAEPAGHPQPPGLVGAVRGRDRAAPTDAANVGVQASARAQGGRLRGVARRGPAARVPDPARAAPGSRCLARPFPALLGGPRRCARTPSRSDGGGTEERKEPMSSRESYVPGPAAGASVEKDGDKWTLVLVRELHHAPDKVWRALTDPAQLREWAPFDADASLGRAGTTVKL